MPRRTPGTANRVLSLCRLLNRHRARYLVAGGVAANLHGSVRATRDVDILVPRHVPNTRRLLAALRELPFGVAGALDPVEVAHRPITIVGDDPRVDILTVAWSVNFDDAWPKRMVRRIEGVRVPYLSLEDLLASKRTGRASDRADVEVLRRFRPARKSRRQWAESRAPRGFPAAVGLRPTPRGAQSADRPGSPDGPGRGWRRARRER